MMESESDTFTPTETHKQATQLDLLIKQYHDLPTKTSKEEDQNPQEAIIQQLFEYLGDLILNKIAETFTPDAEGKYTIKEDSNFTNNMNLLRVAIRRLDDEDLCEKIGLKFSQTLDVASIMKIDSHLSENNPAKISPEQNKYIKSFSKGLHGLVPIEGSVSVFKKATPSNTLASSYGNGPRMPSMEELIETLTSDVKTQSNITAQSIQNRQPKPWYYCCFCCFKPANPNSNQNEASVTLPSASIFSQIVEDIKNNKNSYYDQLNEFVFVDRQNRIRQFLDDEEQKIICANWAILVITGLSQCENYRLESDIQLISNFYFIITEIYVSLSSNGNKTLAGQIDNLIHQIKLPNVLFLCENDPDNTQAKQKKAEFINNYKNIVSNPDFTKSYSTFTA